MNTYTFPKTELEPILSHIYAYGFDIISMTLTDDIYTMTVNGTITEEEFEPLHTFHNLEIVT